MSDLIRTRLITVQLEDKDGTHSIDTDDLPLKFSFDDINDILRRGFNIITTLSEYNVLIEFPGRISYVAAKQFTPENRPWYLELIRNHIYPVVLEITGNAKEICTMSGKQHVSPRNFSFI